MFLLNLLKIYLMNDLDTQNKKMMMLLELRKMGIIDNKLLNIIGNFDREMFLPNKFKGLSKENISLQIFEGVETTTLTDIAKMIFLVLQNNKNTNVVLEIGTGSGMLTAILSKIYGRVYSVEINQKAYKFSTLILKNYSSKIVLKLGDGKNGWKESCPFDAIYVDACIEEEVLQKLTAQLQEDGIIIYVKKHMNYQFYSLQNRYNNFLNNQSVIKVNRSMLV